MRKIYLSFIVLASITACTIEKPATVGVQKFTAVAVGNDIPTRSHIAYPNSESDATNPDGKIVHWDKGDKLYLYDTELRDFTAQDEGGDVTISGEVADWFDDTYYGIYPQSAYRGFSGTTYTTYIPVNQYVDESSNWDPNAPVVVGHCNWDERLIKFYNAHCLVEMYLPGSASSLTLRMMDGSAAGDMTIDVATLATNVIKGNDMVTMTGSMPAHSPIYLVVTPTVSSSGVAVYAYFSSSFTINGETYNAGEYAFRNTNSASFGRDRIVVMNLSNTVPALLNCERLGAHLPDGTMLLRSVDGTCPSTRHRAAAWTRRDESSHLSTTWTSRGH